MGESSLETRSILNARVPFGANGHSKMAARGARAPSQRALARARCLVTFGARVHHSPGLPQRRPRGWRTHGSSNAGGAALAAGGAAGHARRAVVLAGVRGRAAVRAVAGLLRTASQARAVHLPPVVRRPAPEPRVYGRAVRARRPRRHRRALRGALPQATCTSSADRADRWAADVAGGALFGRTDAQA